MIHLALLLPILMLVACAKQSSSVSQSPIPFEQWPNDPVDFYAAGNPLIDFTTYKPVGTDVTSAYLNYWNVADQAALPQDLQWLKNYKVIFVQGIMGNYVDFMGKLIFNHFGEYEYFYDYMDWLKAAGVDYELVKMDTEDPVEENTIFVENAIARSTKQVILVPHSKGGVEALLALTYRPSLHAKVAGVISLQAPFYGTPTANYLHDIKIWDFLANFVLSVLGGSGEAMHDLTSYKRVPWMNQWRPLIEYMLTRVPFLSFATYKDDLPGQDCMFEFSRNKLKRDGGVDNDGLVPWNSMILDETRYVLIEGHDHASIVTDNKFIKFDRARFFKAMLRTFKNTH